MSNIIVPSRRIWTRQPAGYSDVDRSNPIVQGLAHAVIPHSNYDAAKNKLVAVTGTKLAVSKNGRVRGFGATNGVGSTDALGIAADLAQQNTWLIINLANGSGAGSSAGRYFQNAIINWNRDDSTADSHFTALRSSTHGIFRYTKPSAATWHVEVLSYDASSTGNYPSVWVDGISQSVARDQAPSGTFASGMGIASGIGNNDATSGVRVWSGFIGLVLLWNRILTPNEVLSVSQNPWQIFRPQARRTIIDFGASGTTSVSADSALSYFIRSMLSSDNGVQYAIRNAIYKDDAVGYYLRSAIAQNNDVGYILREAIAQDDAEAYKIRGLIQTDGIEAYNVRGLVQTSGDETYSIRGAVQTDVTTNYDIQSSTSVANTNTVSYSVRGSVSGDVSPSYAVRGVAQSDVSAGYSLRALAYRDVAASYAIEAAASSVYADLTASYSIYGVAPSVDYDQIAAAVVAAMQTSPTPFPSNVTHFNGNPTQGSGQPNDPVRPA